MRIGLFGPQRVRRLEHGADRVATVTYGFSGAAGIPAVVVGMSAGMEGGVAGVQLLVPDDRVEAARTVLGDT